MGANVKSVDVAPNGVTGGLTRHDLRITDHASARTQAIHTMCAHLCGNGVAPPPPYGSGPITRTDERFLARVADSFDWDELDHNCWVSQAKVLMQLPAFKNTYHALTALFERDDVIDGAAIKRVTHATTVTTPDPKPVPEYKELAELSTENFVFDVLERELEHRYSVMQEVPRREDAITRSYTQALIQEFETDE